MSHSPLAHTNFARRISSNNHVGFDVLYHHRSSGNYCAFTNNDPRTNKCVGRDPSSGAQVNLTYQERETNVPMIVAGSTEVRALANNSV
jgi:hypothetical protein